MWATVVLLLAAGGLAGCSDDPSQGYSVASQYRSGISSVAVPIWDRGPDVYRRGLEKRITEAVIKRIELNTPYKVTTRDVADTELTGKLTQISQQVMNVDPDTGAARELEMTLTVSFTWRDLRSGKTLAHRKSFSAAGNYIPQAPLGEDFFQGSEDVINRLAERIVEQMEAPW
jgi:hypothetical protein